MEDLQADLSDLQNVLQNSQRENTKKVLAQAIADVNSKISKLQIQITEEQNKKCEVKFLDLNFVPITEYGWEDIDKNTAKIYILKGLDGIKQIDQNNIQCEFEPYSFDLKIRNFNGKNYRFRIDPVFGGLAVEGCKITVKSNSITLTLKKQNPATWTSVKFVKPLGKSAKSEEDGKEKEQEPEGLMDLMKNLYQNGNDEIKRTIGEAWTKSQQNKK